MSEFRREKPESFASPTQLPRTSAEAAEWQKSNSDWWEKNPMRYDWKSSIPHEKFSREFFNEIDDRFFSAAREYLDPHSAIPFDEFIHFDSLKDKRVLEIGIGNGSHAQFLARYSKSFTGIDITEYAVMSTKARMKVFGLKGDIGKMDAEKLEFDDDSFDFVWSWGVIHHSSDTTKILREIHRVLRPGGRAVIMVYHRGWWNYYVTGALEGLVSGNLLKTKSLGESVQLHTDGALARYYSKRDWIRVTRPLFAEASVCVRGPKSDIIPLPAGKLKNLVSSFLPLTLCRFLTGRFEMGGFLVSGLVK
jgi:ubiquinone/menaquinone biosynthesis C-methylase UbiE